MKISDKHISIIENILKNHFEGARILVFGSRVTGTDKEFSDLDLAIDKNSPLSAIDMANAKQDFIDSDLPFSVDLIDLNKVDKKLRTTILNDGKEWNKFSSIPV